MASRKPRRAFSLRNIFFGTLIVVVFFGGTLWALNTFSPTSPTAQRRPALEQMPPLQPISRTSTVIAPVAVSLAAIRNALDVAAPRNLSGKRDNPLSEALGKVDIGWTLSRSPIAVAGRPEGLALSTSLTGILRATGQVAAQAGGLVGTLAGVVGSNLGRNVQKLTTGLLDQRAEIRSNVVVTARPRSSRRGESSQILPAKCRSPTAGFPSSGSR